MRIAVLGATGATGRRLTEQGLASGHQVVAVVRDPERLAGLRPSEIAIAEAGDVDAVAAAIRGVDALASCLGPRRNEPGRHVPVRGMLATLDAMQRVGVERLVAVSASGWVVDGDDPLTRYLAKPILRRVLRDSFADLAEMERLIRASPTRWTIMRPPMLTDRAPRGKYRSRRDGNVRWRFSISRADLALAILDAVIDPMTAGATISVAS
jgi:putative NADH-flavin reductase